jgi:molybdopterin synthase sulfur carrier subunit
MHQRGWTPTLIKVTVRVFANLREILGLKEAEVDLPSDATVTSMIDFLSNNYSHNRLRKEILDENGNLRKFVKILVNGRDSHFLNGPSTPLHDGDVVAVFPPVGGG